jgi:hypothetical protein
MNRAAAFCRPGVLLLVCALLAGCVAETVRQDPPRKGPVKEVGYVYYGGGEVRYSDEGWDWFVAGRRRDAWRRMRHICGKLKPAIVEESNREDADVPYSQEDIQVTMREGTEHFIVAPFTHLVFECQAPAPVAKRAALAAVSSAPAVAPSTAPAGGRAAGVVLSTAAVPVVPLSPSWKPAPAAFANPGGPAPSQAVQLSTAASPGAAPTRPPRR